MVVKTKIKVFLVFRRKQVIMEATLFLNEFKANPLTMYLEGFIALFFGHLFGFAHFGLFPIV